MAKQTGFLKLEGSVGDINFYRTKDGYMVREKSRLSAERIAKDPKFDLTRKNNAEFTNAANAAKMLRKACAKLLQFSRDGSNHTRLFTQMMKVVKADATSVRGQRNVIDGEAELLQGFEFNKNAELLYTLFEKYETDINRVTGVMKVDVTSFIPSQKLLAPMGATHFKLVAMGVEVDFANSTSKDEVKESAMFPWNITPTGNISLEMHVTANSTHPLFLLLGLQFYQETNGHLDRMTDGTFNSLSIVKVSGL